MANRFCKRSTTPPRQNPTSRRFADGETKPKIGKTFFDDRRTEHVPRNKASAGGGPPAHGGWDKRRLPGGATGSNGIRASGARQTTSAAPGHLGGRGVW